MSNDKAKCSNRNCGWIGFQSQMREVVISAAPLKETELHCPRCDCNYFYYNLKPGEVEKPKTGAQLIALERSRQLKIEGWSTQHDDKHTHGELSAAAAVYAAPFTIYRDSEGEHDLGHKIHDRDDFYWAFRLVWPWEMPWLKRTPDNRIRELSKAGALIAAEIDRLRRVASRQEPRPTI